MKKLLCAFLCLIFLVGCSSKSSVMPVNKNITYRAHIFYYEEEYDCLVTINEQGTEYVIKGGEMDGFGARFFDNGVLYSYLGKESENTVPYDKGMLSLLFEMSENSDKKAAEYTDENYVARGSTAIGEFTLFVSGAGLPLYAELDGKDFYVDFYDVSIVKGG